MQTILLEEMTWPEVKTAVDSGFTRVLLMLGSIEQHGPHLPLGTDTMLGYAWGERIARRLGRTILAPVVRPGVSGHHAGFSGTLSLPDPLFGEVVAEYCAWLARSQFRQILLLCSHGGNWPTVRALIESSDLGDRVAPATIMAPNRQDVDRIERSIYRYLEEAGVPASQAGLHAGWRETAHLLALSSGSVRMDRLQCGYISDHAGEALAGGSRIMDLSEHGVLGDPRGADREMGKELNDLVVRLYADVLKARLNEGMDGSRWQSRRADPHRK